MTNWRRFIIRVKMLFVLFLYNFDIDSISLVVKYVSSS